MSFPEILSVVMVAAVCAALMAGYPVALTLGGVSLLFAFAGDLLGIFPASLLLALPARVFGVVANDVLIAIPLFVFMGVMLERSRIAEDLLETMGRLFGGLRGGLGIAVVFVGVLLAAAKGIVGATTVTMGLIVLPTMLRHGYDKRLAAGTVAATATLAQIFPPATVLVLLGDQMSNAYQAAQLAQGIFSPQAVTVSDLFAGAIVPAFGLVLLYLVFLVVVAVVWPASSPAIAPEPDAPHGFALAWRLVGAMIAPLALIFAVLGSILGGIATPSESASIGAVGAILLALWRGERRASWTSDVLVPVLHRTAQIVSMIFLILIGATLFSLVFRGFGGDDMVNRVLTNLPGGVDGAILTVMAAVFLLGFVMDAFEIIFVVVPIVAPVLLKMPGVDPVWLGVMMAMNLQMSYMHPPLGPTLFYLRGVAPKEITTAHIYVGIIPFVLIQMAALVALWFLPGLATWLPHKLYGG
jgi:tripartite ATP-independent transporter DctM subunit